MDRRHANRTWAEGGMNPAMKAGTNIRHPDFKKIGVITQVFAGGEEVSADFENDSLYFESIENFTVVSESEDSDEEQIEDDEPFIDADYCGDSDEIDEADDQ
jgi:hypothetical protein